MSVNSKMTAIANEVRSLSGTTDKLGLETIATNLNEANTEISVQMDLITQIIEALNGKAIDSEDSSFCYPIMGRVDEDNTIHIADDIIPGVYKLYQEADEDDKELICSILNQEIDSTNQLALATDIGGNIFNGIGYMPNKRIGSSGDISSLGYGNIATNPAFATGFIPCKVGDVVQMTNCCFKIGNIEINSDRAMYGHDMGGMRTAFFDENKELLDVNGWAYFKDTGIYPDYIVYEEPADGFLHEFTITNSSVAYFRTSLIGDPETAIITVTSEAKFSDYDAVMKYDDFIPQNVGIADSSRIGVYDSLGHRVGIIPMNTLTPPDRSKKQYSFGAISDIHLQYETAQEDFIRALEFLNEVEDVAFTCIAGDLTAQGEVAELSEYKTMVEMYSPDTPVYAVTGNHDGYNTDIESIIAQYTGHPLYYSFEYNGDVFIMVGIRSSTGGNLFTTAELQWLYETLEANRNRRCFVFHHVRPQDGCGNAFNIYNFDIWDGTEQVVFESLMSHYKNAHQFHGHSHLKFYLQYGSDIANIDHIFGGWSIHIPSLAVPRDGDVTGANSRQELYADSEGYVVDVYENGIHLRGRDFIQGRFIPIASYWLDTTIQTVEAKTYTDSTGTIKSV